MVSYASSVLGLFVACEFLRHVTGAQQFAKTQGKGALAAPKDPASLHNTSEIQALAPLHDENSTHALKLLDLIYEGHAYHAFWKIPRHEEETKASLQKLGQPAASASYGEILPDTFIRLLRHVGASPGQKYYDLGSGTGKTVMAAWLIGLHSTGIELIGKRWNTACTSLLQAQQLGFRKRKNGPGIGYLYKSFSDAEFSDADVIFVNSKTFSPEMMVGLAKAARRMKVGAKIISTAGFPGEDFQLNSKVVGPTSSDKNATWTIQTVLQHTDDAPEPGVAAASLITASSSLMRQESTWIGPTGKKVVHMARGPIFGSMTHTMDVVPTGQTACSLPEGEITDVAAREAASEAKALQ